MLHVLVSFLLVSALVTARPLGSTVHEDHVERGMLSGVGGSWYHAEDHFAAKLFKRQAGPAVGSPAWTNQYPGYATPAPSTVPAAWLQALQSVDSAGLIPNIGPSNLGYYPKGVNGSSPEICSSYLECRAPGDIWDAPDGMLGVSFDDGPTTYSPALYAFLKSQNQSATHFFIGANIRANPDIFMQAYNNGDDIAVHTWSHPYMSDLTNEQIVAELGWTIKIISDLTGGRIPKFWRPPFGASDNRVRAIAQHVFGLVQVNWNQDTGDWNLGTGKITVPEIETELKTFVTGPKSPGLIILEHELYQGSVQAFIDSYPLMKSNGWDMRSIPQLFGLPFYQNSADDTSAVTPQGIIANSTTTASVSAVSSSGSALAAATATQAAASAGSSTTLTTNAAAKKSAAGSRYGVDATLATFLFAFIGMTLA